MSSQRRSPRSARRAPPQTTAAPVPAPTGAPTELVCEAYCSDTKPRTVVAEIAWKVSDTELSDSGFAARVREHELEVTATKDGFSSGNYVNLFSIERHPSFHTNKADSSSPDPEPGLERLVVVGVGRLEADPNQEPEGESPFSLQRFGVHPFGESDAEAVVVKIEGLEPGRNYFWRVPATFRGRRVVSEVIQCKAPICPADFRGDRNDEP